jgi:predicted dehydrogenase
MNKNVLIIGLGKQGQKYVSYLEKYNLYLFDQNKKILKKFKKKYKIINNLDNFLLNNNVDICIVATPTYTHEDIIIKLSEFNIKILCEKPIFSFKKKINKLLRNKHVIKNSKNIYCGYIFRASKQIQVFRKKTQQLLKLNKIDYAFLYLSGTGGHAPWKHNTIQGGGVTNEITSHLIDLSYYIFGKPLKIKICHEKKVRFNRYYKSNQKKFKTNSNDTNYLNFIYKKIDVFIKTDFLSKKVFNFMISSGHNNYLRTSITDKNLNYNINNYDNDFYHSQINDLMKKKPKFLHRFADSILLHKLMSYHLK